MLTFESWSLQQGRQAMQTVAVKEPEDKTLAPPVVVSPKMAVGGEDRWSAGLGS